MVVIKHQCVFKIRAVQPATTSYYNMELLTPKHTANTARKPDNTTIISPFDLLIYDPNLQTNNKTQRRNPHLRIRNINELIKENKIKKKK